MRSISALMAIAASMLHALPLKTQERLAPEEVVRRLQASMGVSMNMAGEVVFRGCPQEDEDGRRVFEAVSAANLPAPVIAETAALWATPYADCNYAPLEAWIERALEEVLRSNDSYAVSWVIDFLPDDISPRMREALWQAVASRYSQGEFSDYIAAKAVRSSNPNARVAMTVAAFRDRPVSANFIYAEAGLLFREYPELYVRALAQAASAMSDERLQAVLGSVSGNVKSGRIGANSPDLVALRRSVQNRQGIPSHLRSLGAN